MVLTEKIWNWFTSSATGAPKKGHPDLNPLDVAKLTKELNLAEEARRLGQAGLPAPDAKTLAGPEALIVQRVEKSRQDNVDWAVLRISVLSQDLGKRNLTQEINRARQSDKEFERKAGALLTEQQSHLRGLGDIARKRRVELEAFQAANGLTRDAHYPTGTDIFFRYAVLLLLIVVEGVLNAGFFAQGLSTGLLGGFTYAGILATLNVLAAFFFGKVLIRNLNHVDTGRKLLGGISLLVALVLMAAIGLGIAHVRDSLTAEVTDPARAALQTMAEHPFQLRDFFSWALFLISVGFGTGALLDGLFIDDLYPGYGDISRRTQEIIDDYEDELSMLRGDLEKLKNEQLKTLDEVVQGSQGAIAVFEGLIEDKKAVGSRLLNAFRNTDNALEALLLKFRDENALHRNGLARPAYFDTKPELRPLPMPDFDTTNDAAALAEQRTQVKALLAEVQSLRASIQDAFNQQFDQLKPLDTHFPRKELS